MTVMGASALLAAGLVASPGAALATPLSTASDQRLSVDIGYLADAVNPVEADVAPSVEDEREELAATGTSSAIGFALIAIALVGGGVTLTVLRRKGVFDG
ncbi:LPXTG cell wall anchor domain-containing protein [Promicromonospora sp. Populi]|uniref:LPXTG cell wall anchor domain-containing protein n=1 Tax=Promicromonospora sp. Populi TaxID=3239420 RepID=UPI0034E1FA6C